VTVTGIKEAGHTAIQPLLCCVAEAVTVMTGLVFESCLATDRYNWRSSAIAFEPHLFHTLCLHYQIAVGVFCREFC